MWCLAVARHIVGPSRALASRLPLPFLRPPGRGACLSGTLDSRVPLRPLSLFFFRSCATLLSPHERCCNWIRKQPTRKKPSSAGRTSHSGMSNGDTGKRAKSTPCLSCISFCLAKLSGPILDWGWSSCVRSNRTCGNGSEGCTDNMGNNCCATNRISDNDIVCQKAVTRCMRTQPR